MHKVAHLLTSLACAGHGRRVQTSIFCSHRKPYTACQQLRKLFDVVPSLPVSQVAHSRRGTRCKDNSWRSSAILLKPDKPASAFQHACVGHRCFASLRLWDLHVHGRPCQRAPSMVASRYCSATAVSPSSRFDVWSFNLRTEFQEEVDGVNGWSKRREAVAGFISKHRPALICVQEATEPMMQFLVDCLGVSKYSWVGTSRTPEQMDETAGFIYDRRRLNLQEHRACWYGPPDATPGVAYWDAAFPRTFEIATFQLKSAAGSKDVGSLRVLNTHLDHVGVEARRRSAELLAVEVQKGADDDAVLAQVVCGDFNSPKGGGNEVYKILTAKGTGLVDSLRDVPPASMPLSTIHKFEGLDFAATSGDGSVDFQGVGDGDDARHIDWILWRSGCDDLRFRLLESRVITDCLENGLYPSDHFPICVSFHLDDTLLQEG